MDWHWYPIVYLVVGALVFYVKARKIDRLGEWAEDEFEDALFFGVFWPVIAILLIIMLPAIIRNRVIQRAHK